MLARTRLVWTASVAPLLLSLAAAACGPNIDAVVVAGSVTWERHDAETVVATGPIAYVRGTTLTASQDGAEVRVDCGGHVSAQTTGGRPVPGIVDFDLEDGAQLRRRDDSAFDLVEGAAHMRTGGTRSRLMVLHGRCYMSAAVEDNPDGIDVRLVTHGDQLKAEVVKGKVLLNVTDAEERNTIFVTLEAGDGSVVKPGESPKKGATDWYVAEE